MEKSQQSYPAETNGHPAPDELTLGEVVRKLRSHFRLVLKAVAVCLVVAVLFLIGSRNEYEASASLMPEQQKDGLSMLGGLGMLQQLGGLMGLGDASMLSSQQAIPVELYPKILESTPVLWTILQRRVRTSSGQTLTLYEYLDEGQPFDLWDAAGHAVRSAARSLGSGSADQSRGVIGSDSSLFKLSSSQIEVLKDVRDRIDALYNVHTGVLEVTVAMPDPEVAGQVGQVTVEELTRYMTSYRLQKRKSNLAFIEDRYGQARDQFNASLNKLARFRDQNQHLSRDIARTEEERLQAEYDLAFNVYNTLATRLEEARIKLQEETPVFQVLEPVSVPLTKSYPPTILTLVLSIMIGLVAGAGWVVFRDRIQEAAPAPLTWRAKTTPVGEEATST